METTLFWLHCFKAMPKPEVRLQIHHFLTCLLVSNYIWRLIVQGLALVF